MTPKQRIVAALELQQPDDIVPTFELFGLTGALMGRDFVDVGELTGSDLDRGVKENAQLHVEVAERLDYSAICVGDIRVIRELVRLGADRTYLLTYKNGDRTWRFWREGDANADGFAEACVRLFDDPDGFKRELDAATDRTIAETKPLIDAGIGAIFMGADYATTQGPFLSPVMFGEFIAPFLHRTIAGHQANGAYVIKHTDGGIMPILDQIVACAPDALVSIDPTAGMDIAEVKRRVGDRICLGGNVDCSPLMRGARDEIRRSALYCLKHGMPGGGYIFMSSNSVYPPVEIEDYLFMLDIRKQYGRYDRPVEIPI